jgi:hypothetical protein
LDPDNGEKRIDAVKSQFSLAAKQIASDLGIDVANVEYDSIEREDDPEVFFDARGGASSGIPSFEFSVKSAFRGFGPNRELRLRAMITIEYEQHAPAFAFEQDITSKVGHQDFLIRWAAWAVHNFNLTHHPPNLESLIGDVYVRVCGLPQSLHPTETEFQLLMKGLQVSNSKVTVLKFRHVDPGNGDRSYSYAIWAETEISGLWIFFCKAGGLDSGGWYQSYKRIEGLIHDLGANVTVKNFDMRYRDLERFLLRRGAGFDTLYSGDFDLESFQHELLSLDSLGGKVSDAFRKSEESFWKEDYAGSLRDLRAVVQDALEYVAQLHHIDLTSVKDPDVPNIAGKLVGANVLEGRLTPWFQSFASIANLASHGTYPTEADWLNPRIRVRVLCTFVLGRQLLIELQYCLPPRS